MDMRCCRTRMFDRFVYITHLSMAGFPILEEALRAIFSKADLSKVQVVAILVAVLEVIKAFKSCFVRRRSSIVVRRSC